ncbi:LOW QUALITY PROTEIN: hypothetical protein HID58_069898 [Brassica napus]|uniref:Uncharacterized protein n=1 Tax=Brassica napus TaxID=3708 RepID=A0ABQ7YXB3_BRANA|nr:LOW QUALITY PROTEIN: hypothetical protein HID58_069898 [Brassica napus]
MRKVWAKYKMIIHKIDSLCLLCKWFNGTYDPRKTENLLATEGAEERLKLFKKNLLEEGSFDSAIDGVFHTASPFYHDVKDPQAELLDPAVKGTINLWCVLSKTLAEDAAWKLVSVNQAMVIGPLLQPTLNTSAAALLSLIKDVQMKKVFIPTYKVSKEKAESLGVEFVPLEIQNERIIIQMISAIIFHR